MNYTKTQISFSATICNGAFLDFEIFFFFLWIINQEKYNIFLAINPYCLEKIINQKKYPSELLFSTFVYLIKKKKNDLTEICS